MLRPGGFQEYSPKEQKIFDIIHNTIQTTFAQYGYQHIHTPAVESIDTLKKGGDEVSKQIFGLYGLAQGPEDTKDYALHFDLTVPFARYVLDRQNELAFPFKRYQIQPVWRGERHQKGRYKEFRQADIDVIWKGENKKLEQILSLETIQTLSKTLDTIISTLGMDIKFSVNMNSRVLMKYFFNHYIPQRDYNEYLKVLDGYYKNGGNLEYFFQYFQIEEDMEKDLGALFDGEFDDLTNQIKDNSGFMESLGVIERFVEELKSMELNHVQFFYDPSIVRGLDYYTDIVFEVFVVGKYNLGSVCSGGAYANLTEFLDPKQSFSGVGGSIGLSRLMSVLMEEYKIMETFVAQEESYLVIHEEHTSQQAQDLVAKLHQQGKIAEIYPLPEKQDKQFKYAEKKGIASVIRLFQNEDTRTYKVKHLAIGKEEIFDIG